MSNVVTSRKLKQGIDGRTILGQTDATSVHGYLRSETGAWMSKEEFLRLSVDCKTFTSSISFTFRHRILSLLSDHNHQADYFCRYGACWVCLCCHSVCAAYNAVITVKHILFECADLLEIRKKYLKRNLCIHSFGMWFRKLFLTCCERLVCFTKYEAC